MTFAGAAVVLVAVGILAAWLPAHRAAHLDPVTVLREGRNGVGDVQRVADGRYEERNSTGAAQKSKRLCITKYFPLR